jgi:hypothetical protein
VWPGILILVALLVTSLLTFFGDRVRRATAEGPRLTILAAEVGGLERGSPVWLAGKPSGRVRGLSFLEPGGDPGARVAIETVLLREAMPFVRADARVTIGASGLLAPAVVKIGPGSPDAPPVADGDTLRAVSRPDIDDFRAMADSVRISFEPARVRLSRLQREIADGGGDAARFMRDREFLVDLASARKRAARVQDAWRGGGGLARISRDDSVRLVTAKTIEQLSGLVSSDEVRHWRQSVEETTGMLQSVGDRAVGIAGGIERAEGTIGRSVRDSALAVQASRTRALLDSLTVELGVNPLSLIRIQLF